MCGVGKVGLTRRISVINPLWSFFTKPQFPLMAAFYVSNFEWILIFSISY